MRNEEPHNLYASPNIVKMIKSMGLKWTGHVARMGEMRNAYNWVGKPMEERHHSEDNIRMDNMEIGWEGVDWIYGSGQGPRAGSCEHNEIPGSIKGEEILD